MRINISLPKELVEGVQNYCEREGFTFSGLIQKLLKKEYTILHKDTQPLNDNELRNQVCTVCKVFNGHKSDCHLLQISLTRNEVYGLPGEKKVIEMLKETKKIVSKVKKSETCPHMISVGGICNPCGGIAK